MKMFSYVSIVALVLSVGASIVRASPDSPWDVDTVRSGLIEVGTAYEITQKCPSASVRKFRGVVFLYGLVDSANDAGFSNSEIDTFMNDSNHKTNLERIVWTRLTQHGARKDDTASVCAAADKEKAMRTQASGLFSISSD
jgi:hypothetical protein